MQPWDRHTMKAVQVCAFMLAKKSHDMYLQCMLYLVVVHA